MIFSFLTVGREPGAVWRLVRKARSLGRVVWQGGSGWWIIPGAIAGAAIWAAIILWIVDLLFPN